MLIPIKALEQCLALRKVTAKATRPYCSYCIRLLHQVRVWGSRLHLRTSGPAPVPLTQQVIRK